MTEYWLTIGFMSLLRCDVLLFDYPVLDYNKRDETLHTRVTDLLNVDSASSIRLMTSHNPTNTTKYSPINFDNFEE